MSEQDRLIERLIKRNIFKLEDGRDLYEGSSEELVRLLKGDEGDCNQLKTAFMKSLSC